MFRSLVHRLLSHFPPQSPEKTTRIHLRIEGLEDRALPSAMLRFGVVGDSASYAGTPSGAAGDMEWTQVLQATHSKEVQIINLANQSASSSSIFTDGQISEMAHLIEQHKVDFVFLVVGTNDVIANLPTIFAGNYQPFVQTVVSNIEKAVDTFAKAGDVGQVIWNVPDVGLIPGFQTLVTHNPALLQQISNAVNEANADIVAFGAAKNLPVFDLNKGLHVALSPVIIDGVQLNQHVFAADAFHPSTAANGYVVNEQLQALHIAYGLPIQRLRLSDQEIFALAGLPHDPGRTYFDIRPFVVFSGIPDLDDGLGHHRHHHLEYLDPFFAGFDDY
jgi:lysophospholipase L1-like esterase